MENTYLRKVLRSIVRSYKPHASVRVLGAHEHDPKVTTLPTAIAINTQPIYKPGEHWVGIYIDERRRGYFFDSFGHHPRELDKKCWEKFLTTNCKTWQWNNRPIQPLNSVNCGYYVIKCILGLVKGKKFGTIIKGLNEGVIRKFKRELRQIMK